MKQRNKDGVRRTSFDGDLTVTKELLLAPHDCCTLDRCGLRMSEADPSSAVIVASRTADTTICVRFCSESHVKQWRSFELPRMLSLAGYPPASLALLNVQIYRLGDRIVSGRENFQVNLN